MINQTSQGPKFEAHATALAQAEQLKNAMCGGQSELNLSSAATCLTPLLNALHWRGHPADIAEALPHFAQELDDADLRDVLARLGYNTSPLKLLVPGHIDERLLPCLYRSWNGQQLVILERKQNTYRIFNGANEEEETITGPLSPGLALIVKAFENDDPLGNKQSFLKTTVRKFKPLFKQIFALSLAINLLSLTVPLAIMMVYDQVITKRAPESLLFIAGGALAALLWEFLLKRLRAKSQSFLAGRLEYMIGSHVFEHILNLPAAFTERAPVGGQVSRLREFENLREVFAGPLGSLMFDLPFVLLFVGVIALISPPLSLIPLGLILAYIILGAFILPPIRKMMQQTGRFRAERQGLLTEILTRMEAIKLLGSENIWYDKYRKLSARATNAHVKTGRLLQIAQSFSQTIMMISGVLMLYVGVNLVMAQELTLGGLIASMALGWRVLSPFQTCFNVFHNLEQAGEGISQLNKLLAVPTEAKEDHTKVSHQVIKGAINFNRVSLRYQPQSDPALLNVSCNIKPGEIIAITGPSGAGKTTMLRALLGLDRPQMGMVSIDGRDIRQTSAHELRRHIGYLPQNSQDFYGTVAQNLMMSNPTASHEDMVKACRKAGLINDVIALPDGFDTRLGNLSNIHLPSGFMQRLGLARAYLRNSKVLLLDEPANMLDEAAQASLLTMLANNRGEQTIILVTHQPQQMRQADRVFVMNNGQIVRSGTPDKVLPALLGKKQEKSNRST